MGPLEPAALALGPLGPAALALGPLGPAALALGPLGLVLGPLRLVMPGRPGLRVRQQACAGPPLRQPQVPRQLVGWQRWAQRQGGSSERSHGSTPRRPPSAARVQAHSSHGQGGSSERSHCSMPSWPSRAAALQARSSQGQGGAWERSHGSMLKRPSAAAGWQAHSLHGQGGSCESAATAASQCGHTAAAPGPLRQLHHPAHAASALFPTAPLHALTTRRASRVQDGPSPTRTQTNTHSQKGTTGNGSNAGLVQSIGSRTKKGSSQRGGKNIGHAPAPGAGVVAKKVGGWNCGC